MRQAQIDKLKQIAVDKYDQDGGTMYECSDEQDYIDAIEESGTASKAWKSHLEIHEIRKEVGGYYERDITQSQRLQPGIKTMNRYETADWKELVAIQNTMTNIDILTITGFMDDKELLKHLEYYRSAK